MNPEQVLALLAVIANSQLREQRMAVALQQAQARVAQLEAQLAAGAEGAASAVPPPQDG